MPDDPIPREVILAVVAQLRAAGLEISLPYLTSDLSNAAILLALSDPISFRAWAWGVTREQYLAWRGHDFICHAKTRKRVQCKMPVLNSRGTDEFELPDGFDPKAPKWCYCRIHLSM